VVAGLLAALAGVAVVPGVAAIAQGTADLNFTGPIEGSLTQPAALTCKQDGPQLVVNISGPVGSGHVSLEISIVGYSGSGGGMFEVPAKAQGALSGQLATGGAISAALNGGFVVLHSADEGVISARYGTAPDEGGIAGSWSCPLTSSGSTDGSGYSAAQIVARVNAQRAANFIPAGVSLNSSWSEGCHQLDDYEHLHGDNFAHSENPGPGYSALGDMVAQSGPLLAIDGGSSVEGWATNPFEGGPSHLFALLDPRLSVTGADDSVFSESSILVEEICVTTTIGYLRPPPEKDTVWTYPGNGASIYPEETADELPQPPGVGVGIPNGATTGPYLLVFVDGIFQPGSAKLTKAALEGPGGAVAVKFVTRPGGGGGFVIPVSPLDEHATYRASVTISVPGAVVRHYWTFTTNSADRQAGGARGPGRTVVEHAT